jgi:hypothetical protein
LIIIILNIIAAILNIIIRVIDILRSRKSPACISDKDQEIVKVEALKNIIITNVDNKKQTLRQGQTAGMSEASALKMEKKGKLKIVRPDFDDILSIF